MTKKELADCLGLSPRQIDNLVVDGLPRAKVGRRYEYGPEAVAWYYQRKIEALEEKADRPASWEEARARRELAQAEIAEYELQRLRGQMVTVEDAGVEMARLLDGLRAVIVGMPGKYPPRLVNLKSHGEARQALEAVAHDVLQALVEVADDLDSPPAANGDRPGGDQPSPQDERGKRAAKAGPAAEADAQ